MVFMLPVEEETTSFGSFEREFPVVGEQLNFHWFSRREEENHKFKYLPKETWGNLFSSFICLRFIDIRSSGRQGVVFFLPHLLIPRTYGKKSRKINLNTRVTGSSSDNPGKWIGWRWWFNKDFHSVRSSSALPCNWRPPSFISRY